VVLVVEAGDGGAQRFDAGRGRVLAAVDGDLDLSRPQEAALDLVLDLGCALAQVGPLLRVVEVAALVGAFGGPDDAGRRARRVQAGVRLVALVALAELQVDGRVELWAGSARFV
jgi:hypothetical protein